MPLYSDPDPLVGQRAAQPLVRLLVRPRHVHPALQGRRRQTALPGDDQGRGPVRRHRSGPLLPHLHDLLRELHPARTASPSTTRSFDRRDVYIITQNALADGTYLCYIRAQYNRSTQIDPPFFQELFRPEKERQQNYTTNLLGRAVAPLDRFFTGLGAQRGKAPAHLHLLVH